MSATSRWRSRTQWIAVLGVVGLVSVGIGAVLTSASGSGGSSAFVPMTPCRLMDTRATSQVGPRGTPIGSNELYSAPVWGANGNCSIPATATAVSLNVTFVNPTSAGFVAVFPPDKPNPGTSNLNFIAGQAPAPNGVTSPLSFDGKIGFFNAAGTVNLIADIVGYYEKAGSAPGGIVAGNCGAILRWDLPECRQTTFPTSDGPRFLAFDGTNLWIANQNANTVSKTNPVTGAKVDFPVGSFPFGVAFDGTSIWVANFNGNNVSKVNTVTGTKVDLPTGTNPFGVAFDGSNIWVTNFSSNNVSRFNAITGTFLGNFATQTAPRGLAYDGYYMWVANSATNTVSKIDKESGTKVDIPVGAQPRGVAFDGTNIWVANSGDDDVSRINIITHSRTDFALATGANPQELAFDGTYIWVTNLDTHIVSKFDPVTGDRIDYPTVNNPTGIAFDGSNMWVTHISQDTLTKFVT